MRIKRLLSAVICFLLLLTAVGCKSADTTSSSPQQTTEETEKNSKIMKMLYCYSDTFNPYTAQTELNRNLCSLIFEPLFKVNNNFEAKACVAESAVLENNVCTVKLKNNILFSDGTALTAKDVVHSYNLAKGSATAYATQLYEVRSVLASNDHTVVFELTRSDSYFLNLLNFPIIKMGSENRTDVDSVVLPPIGSGIYVANDARDTLVHNPHYHGKLNGVETIRLTNAPDKESVSHYVEIGATDIYFTDVSDGNIVRMSGKRIDVNLNNFVYIGVNHSYGALSSRYLRYAISSALNRSEICQAAYYNNALAATGFFSPVFEPIRATQTIKNTQDTQIAIENLEKIGYNSLNGEGKRVNATGGRLSFTLLVNGDNISRASAADLIVKQLGDCGISVTVIRKPYAEYVAALTAGHFQLYLGETQILPNMDMSNVVLAGGSVAYGIAETQVEEDAEEPNEDTQAIAGAEAQPTPLSDIIGGFYSGSHTIADVANAMLTEMPVIPVCYRTGLLFYNSRLEGVTEASQSDIYFSSGTYNIKK